MHITSLLSLFVVVYVHLVSMIVSGQVVEMSQQITDNEIHLRQHISIEKNDKQFSFASYYNDHMVLQRAPRRAVIWGYASSEDIGKVVTVSFNGKTSTTDVYLDQEYKYGAWRVALVAETQPGPFIIKATLGAKSIQLQDVLFGDVWICSGQSNMQFTVNMGMNATEEIQAANNFPHIRLFTVKDVVSKVPIPDINSILEKWTPASNVSVGGKTWSYFSAVCWLYGRDLYKQLGYPIGLIDTSWGGTPVEAWSSKDALAKCNLGEPSTYQYSAETYTEQTVGGPRGYSVLWNGMIHPLINMTIYGAIWYQGEQNVNMNAKLYNCTFPAMIDDWRSKFHKGSQGETDAVFPFGFVQLAPSRPYTTSLGFPTIRWKQTANYGYVPNPRMNNVFMAVAIDLPDFASPYGNIHPRDKQDVAARLTLSGLAVAYGKNHIAYQGPLPARIVEGTGIISLEYKENITLNNLIGFEGLCKLANTSVIYWTQLAAVPVGKQPRTLSLWAQNVCGPGGVITGVRYLWKESPCAFKTCTVYSEANPLLPGPPFVVMATMTNIEGTVHDIDWSKPVNQFVE